MPCLLLVVGSLLTSCGKQEAKVYRVPKEAPVPVPAAAAANESNVPEIPQIRYAAPKDWEEKPAGGMRVANFRIPGTGGEDAEVSVLPIPGTASDLEVINIFREQMGLTPLSEEKLAAEAEGVAIGDAKGKLLDLSSTDSPRPNRARTGILLASLTRDKLTWFFKLSGDPSLVARQKAAFLEFLKSVSFAEGSSLATRARPEQPINARPKGIARNGDTMPDWTIPSGWQEQPASAMLLKSYLVSGKASGKATVTIGVFPGQVGGPLMNVNRWRDQLSLGPIEEGELPSVTRSLDVIGGKAMLVEIAGADKKTKQNASMVAAMVPRDDSTWVYKLMGDEQVVAQEKDAFIKFVQTVRYPNA